MSSAKRGNNRSLAALAKKDSQAQQAVYVNSGRMHGLAAMADEYEKRFAEAEALVLSKRANVEVVPMVEMEIDKDKYRQVIDRVRAILEEGVVQANSAEMGARRQLRTAVMNMSRALRTAMEMVELIEMGDRSRTREKARGLREQVKAMKDKLDSKMVAINIVRVVCITLELTCPAFSTAWLIFRLSGFYMADQLEHLADSIETRRACCTIA